MTNTAEHLTLTADTLRDDLRAARETLRDARRKYGATQRLLEQQHRAISKLARQVGTTKNPKPVDQMGLAAAEAELEPLAVEVAERDSAVRAARSECLRIIEQIEQQAAVERVVGDLAQLWACRCGWEYPAPSFPSYVHDLLDGQLQTLGKRATADPATLQPYLRQLCADHRI